MNTENVKADRELEERAKLLFDESVSALDARTRSKLTQARYRALEELDKTAPAWTSRWLPAGAVAAGILAVMVLWQGSPPGVPDAGDFNVAATTDLEILMGSEELEMIEELEFYAWLDEQAELSPGDSVEDGVG